MTKKPKTTRKKRMTIKSLRAADRHAGVEQHIEADFAVLVQEVSRTQHSAGNQILKQTRLTRSQSRALLYIYRHDGASQSDLAAFLKVGKPSAGDIVQRLEKKGWVERRPDDKDGRIKRLYITDKAAPVIDTFRVPWRQFMKQALAGVSLQQKKDMVKSLRQVLANLEGILSERRA